MAIVRDLPMAEYLASSNAGAHQLKDFSVSPRLYFDKYVAKRSVIEMDDEDDEEGGAAEKAAESRARVFGIAFEMYMDDLPLFDRTYVIMPLVEPDGSPFKTTKKLGKAWKAEQLALGKIILKPKELAAMEQMRSAFHENPEAVELLESCERQVTMTCEWPEQTEDEYKRPEPWPHVILQSRPDYVSFKGCALSQFRPYTVDLKTVDKMPRMYTRRVIVEYGYDNQAEIARTCMEQNGYPETVHYLLACEKSAPHRCVVFELDREFLKSCEEWLFNNAINLAQCHEADEWPRSREPGIIVAMKPEWKKADGF